MEEEFADDENSDEKVMNDESVERFEKLTSSSNQEKTEISYEQGIIHLAAAIASNFREDKSLGTMEMKSEIPSQMFANGVNKGGLLKPTEKWLADVTKMDQLFMDHHPNDFLVKGVGLTEDFTKKLEENISGRKTEILGYFCRARTRARIRHINRRIMAPKKGTLRGRRKQIEWVF